MISAKQAYVEGGWSRVTIEEFGFILKYFAQKLGHEDIVSFDVSRDFYEKIAKIADDIIAEAIYDKKIILKEGKAPKIPSWLTTENIDDFIEIVVSLKHYGSSDDRMDKLDKERNSYVPVSLEI